MKPLNLISKYLGTFLIMVLPILNYAQTTISNKLEVRYASNVETPQITGVAPSALATIYANYDVSDVIQMYPQASSFDHPLADDIGRVYELTCDCDESALLTAISALIPTYIENAQLMYEPFVSDISMPPFIPNDPEDASWNMFRLENINAYEAWEITKGDPEIKIAISDTGFDLDHEDLIDKIVYTAPGIVTSGFHGTLVASCAAASTDNGKGHSAIGFNCSLMLFPMGMNSFLDASLLGADVINASWGHCYNNPNDQDIITMVTDMGLTIVSASGNGSLGASCGGTNDNGYLYPSAYPEIISVSGTGPNNCLGYEASCWSSYMSTQHFTQNDAVDVLAAGMCTRGAYPNDNYDFGIGTSFAGPIVAGVVGLMLSVNPCLTPSEVMEIIKSTDQDVFDESVCSGLNEQYEATMPGVGLVDAYASVVEALATQGEDFHVEDNQFIVWNGETIDDVKDIYVHSGGTLVIRNSNVLLPKGASIIVEREAKLYISGSDITSKCDKPSSRWAGIFVHGNSNLEQPEVDFEDFASVLSYNFNSNESGIVVIKDESILKNSRYGVSTQAPGYTYDPDQIERWGGLVLIDNSSFINVRTGVHFMKYDFPNKSMITNSTFLREADYDAKISGITVWACNEITVEGNTFSSLTNDAIRTIDYYGAITDLNNFENCKNGISNLSTAPKQSGLKIDGNLFSGNKQDIISTGPDLANGLVANDNAFSESTLASIVIDGPTQYTVSDNSFTENFHIDVALINSEDSRSILVDNSFIDGPNGIIFYGPNNRSSFLYNCFDKETNDVVLYSSEIDKAEIRLFQGFSTIPAGNCFTNLEEPMIAEPENAELFFYFTPLGGESELDECLGKYVPEEDENEFINIPSLSAPEENCGSFYEYIPPSPAPVPILDFEDLGELNEDIMHLSDSLALHAADSSIKLLILNKLDEKDEALGILEEIAVRSNDYEDLIDFYANETGYTSKLKLYGLYLKTGDYVNAEDILSNLPKSTDEEEEFYNLQVINLSKFLVPTNEISSIDLEYLINVAEGTSKYRGYASALASL